MSGRQKAMLFLTKNSEIDFLSVRSLFGFPQLSGERAIGLGLVSVLASLSKTNIAYNMWFGFYHKVVIPMKDVAFDIFINDTF